MPATLDRVLCIWYLDLVIPCVCYFASSDLHLPFPLFTPSYLWIILCLGGLFLFGEEGRSVGATWPEDFLPQFLFLTLHLNPTSLHANPPLLLCVIHLRLLCGEGEGAVMSMCTQSSTWRCHETFSVFLTGAKSHWNFTLFVCSVWLPHSLPPFFHQTDHWSWKWSFWASLWLPPHSQPSLSGLLVISICPCGFACTFACTYAWEYAYSFVLMTALLVCLCFHSYLLQKQESRRKNLGIALLQWFHTNMRSCGVFVWLISLSVMFFRLFILWQVTRPPF